MKSLFIDIPLAWRWPGALFLGLSLGLIFLADLIFLPQGLTLLLPYVLVIILGTLWIGNGVGLIFCLLTLLFWTMADTKFFTSVPDFFALSLAIKAVFLLLEYSILYSYRQLHSEAKSLSLRDSLTGLNNRRAFLWLAEAILRSNTRKATASTLLFLDVDNFKQVNDTLGHQEGDAVLVALARILVETARETDVCARLGGDEFCVLLSGEQEQQGSLAPRLRDRFAQVSGEPHWPTTLSIGTVQWDGLISVEQLVEQADSAMYQAKKSGKNTIVELG